MTFNLSDFSTQPIAGEAAYVRVLGVANAQLLDEFRHAQRPSPSPDWNAKDFIQAHIAQGNVQFATVKAGRMIVHTVVCPQERDGNRVRIAYWVRQGYEDQRQLPHKSLDLILSFLKTRLGGAIIFSEVVKGAPIDPISPFDWGAQWDVFLGSGFEPAQRRAQISDLATVLELA